MKTHTLALAAVLLASPVYAQETTIDRPFLLWSGALLTSSIFDAETTLAAIKSGNAHESNPMAKAFVGNGSRSGTYAFVLVTDAVFIGLAYRMKRNGNRLWKLPLIAGTVAHAAAGGLNLRYVN